MTVDEILADAATALDIPAGAVPLYAFVVVDYVDAATGARFLRAIASEGLPEWCAIGMVNTGLAAAYEDADL
jgi:hypothetical protein